MIEQAKKTVFVETYGWPYLPVLHDDSDDFKEDKWLGVKELRYNIHQPKPLKFTRRII